MEDRKLVCKDCNNEFVFTIGEQEFYKEKGFENGPVDALIAEEQEGKKSSTQEDSFLGQLLT